MKNFSIESLNRLFELHKQEDFFMQASTSGDIEVPFKLMAKDFLKFAKTDVSDSR